MRWYPHAPKNHWYHNMENCASTSLSILLYKSRSFWVATVLLLLVETNFWHRLTDLHLLKLIMTPVMTELTFRNVSKLSSAKRSFQVNRTNLKFAIGNPNSTLAISDIFLKETRSTKGRLINRFCPLNVIFRFCCDSLVRNVMSRFMCQNKK